MLPPQLKSGPETHIKDKKYLLSKALVQYMPSKCFLGQRNSTSSTSCLSITGWVNLTAKMVMNLHGEGDMMKTKNSSSGRGKERKADWKVLGTGQENKILPGVYISKQSQGKNISHRMTVNQRKKEGEQSGEKGRRSQKKRTENGRGFFKDMLESLVCLESTDLLLYFCRFSFQHSYSGEFLPTLTDC